MESTSKPAAGGDTQAVEKAASDARAAERQRLQDLEAAFPKDPAFAVEQWKKGASVDQAKVAYCDVVLAREGKLQEELAGLKKASATPAPRTSGAPAVPQVAAGADSAQGDEDRFLAAARRYQSEEAAKGHRINLFQAISATIRREPALYREHQEHADARRGEIASRKRQLGIK